MKYKDLYDRIYAVVIEMSGNILKRIFNKSKKNNKSYIESDYAFSPAELNELNRENKEKIIALKSSVKNKVKKKNILEVLDSIDNKERNSSSNINVEEEEVKEEEVKEDNNSSSQIPITYDELVKAINKNREEKKVFKYLELSDEMQKRIIEALDKIDIKEIESDIFKGKDILQHNYSISYADDALGFIYKIRVKYEVLIEYLIGFNNEKKEIYNKTIFSDNKDNEWHYLKSYISILERIKDLKN